MGILNKNRPKNKGGAKKLTSGSVWKSILFFALPLLGSSLVQQMYSTVDLIFVGRFIGKEAAAAVGSGDLLLTCLIGLFTGISVGSGVIAAHSYGSDDRERFHDTLQTVYSFGIIGSFVLFIIGESMAPVFLRWLNTPEEIMAMATTYLRIYFCGIFAIVSYNLCSGVVRALGDSASAFRFQVFGGIVNIVGDFLFIVVFRWGIVGAALATALSQTMSALITIRYLTRIEEDIALKITKITIHKGLLAQVMRIGIPSGIQSMIISFSNLFIQSIINGLGVDSMAAFAAYLKVELFVYYPIIAFGQALVTFTAQNMGAGQLKRVKQGIKTTLILGMSTVLVLSLIMLTVSRQIFGLFNSDPGVIANGVMLMRITFPFYFIYVLQESMSSATKGIGYALSPMIIIVSCMCILRIILLQITTAMWHNLQAVAVVYPITWLCAGIAMTINFYRIYRRNYGNQLSGIT